MRKTTLCYLIDGDKILLAMKKRGFGAGKWNGTGGKLHDGETVAEAAIRETAEETGVRIAEVDLEKVSDITFHFEGVPENDQHCEVFFTRKWRGEPTETDEMAPLWFNKRELPWNKMWVDDPEWLPLALLGKKTKAVFRFTKDGSEILDSAVHEVAGF